MGGIFSYLFTQLGFTPDKSASLVVVGLDNAGKTTLLTKLSTGKLSTSLPPTKRAVDETFHLGGITFKAWDLGGHEAVRHLWSDYSTKSDGIVFMVDATDPRRFQESGEELEMLLIDLYETQKNNNVGDETRPTPIVILLNKYDQDNALPMKEVVLSLGLEDILSEWGNEEESDESDESDDEDSDGNENGKIPPPPIEVFCCSVVENRGYQAAFKWLSEFIE